MARSGTAKLNSASSKKTSRSFINARKGNATPDTSPKKVIENGVKLNKKDHANTKSENSFSKDDVLALGGDDQDYDDLKDLDSDADIRATNEPVDAKLSKEVASFVKTLKISKKYKDVEDEDEGNDAKTKDTIQSDIDINVPGSKPAINTPRTKDSLASKSDVGPSKGSSSSKAHLIIEPGSQWYSAVPPLSAVATDTLTNDDITKLQARADTLFKKELNTYASSEFNNSLTASSSDKAFLQQILTGGTLSDRLSALTLMAQSSPVHNMKALESLRSMSQKKGREESLKAMRAIVDWWTGGGAPDRKLKHFREQPLSHPSVSDSVLLVWYFEDWLKKYFFGIIQTLETLSLDPLVYVRMQSISLIFGLLRDKPEQEQNLLRLLVNKLGDSEKQVAARASYHLQLLLQSHPQMKSIVTKEVASLVLRPSSQKSTSSKAAQKKPAPGETHDLQRSHSQYYGVITLNQITLMPKDHEVAVQLLNVYFDLFKEILGEDPKSNSEEDDLDKDAKVDDDVDLKKGRRNRPKFSKKGGKKQKKDTGFVEVEDSRSKLVSAILTGVNRAFPYTKQGVATDDLLKRIDIMFRITHTSTFNISIQALRFILNLCTTIAATPSTSPKSTPDKLGSIPDRYYRTLYTSLEDSRLATSSKQAMYLNLLFKSLTVDKDKERVKSFVRRFVQLLWCGASGGAEFAAGGLYLLAELFKYEPGLRDMFEPTSKSPSTEQDVYDPRKRDPKYANASSTSMWEFAPLLYHYHPTVRLHATQLISNQELSGSADLTLNTLSHFLDRFVYKNPKKGGGKSRGMSAMQPAAMVFDTSAVRVMKGNAGGNAGEGAVNEEWFLRLDKEDVPADEYFSKKKKYGKKLGGAEANEGDVSVVEKANKDDNNDADENENEGDSDSDSDESEIWQAIKQSVPVPGGDGDDDDDDDLSLPDMSDLDDDDDDDISLLGMSDSDSDADSDAGAEMFKGFEGLSDEEEDIDGDLPAHTSKKRTREVDEAENIIDNDNSKSSKKKKKSKRSLPTFASYDDYAKMVEDDTGLE